MVKLQTSEQEAHQIAQILDDTRPSTELVKVPREVLKKLYFDHTAMSAKLGAN